MSRCRNARPNLAKLAASLRWVPGQSVHDYHVRRSPFASAIYFGRSVAAGEVDLPAPVRKPGGAS